MVTSTAISKIRTDVSWQTMLVLPVGTVPYRGVDYVWLILTVVDSNLRSRWAASRLVYAATMGKSHRFLSSFEDTSSQHN